MIRIITQILVGLMLIFGTLTLVPKAMACLRGRQTARGVLYIFLGLLSLLFSAMAFESAITALLQ